MKIHHKTTNSTIANKTVAERDGQDLFHSFYSTVEPGFDDISGIDSDLIASLPDSCIYLNGVLLT